MALPPWCSPPAVLAEVVWLVDHSNNAAEGWTREEIMASLVQRHNPQDLQPQASNVELHNTLGTLWRRGNLKAMGGGAHGRYTLSDSEASAHQASSAVQLMALPPWLSPPAVLAQVVRLVDEGTDEGWTREEIKASLVQRHNLNLQDLPPQIDAELQKTLATLREGGDLKAMGGGAHPRYTLSGTTPYLPPWCGPNAVLQAVGHLDHDNGNNNGSTWARIRNFLMDAHQPQQPQPPRGFEGVLRMMLLVLRKTGHLARGAGGPQHYTLQQSPGPILAPVDPRWCYCLGYKLGRDQ